MTSDTQERGLLAASEKVLSCFSENSNEIFLISVSPSFPLSLSFSLSLTHTCTHTHTHREREREREREKEREMWLDGNVEPLDESICNLSTI
jgi:hypothetical protein